MLWKCFSGLLLRVYNGTQQTGVPKFNSPSQNPLTVYFSSPSVHSQKNLHSHVRQLSQTGYVPPPSSRAHQLTLITLEVSAPLLAPLVSLPTCCRQAMNDALKHLPRLLFAARAFSTIPARAPRTNVVGALALGTAVAGYALYESTSCPLSL